MLSGELSSISHAGRMCLMEVLLLSRTSRSERTCLAEVLSRISHAIRMCLALFSGGPAFKDKLFGEDLFSRGAFKDKSCGKDVFSGDAFMD